MNIISILKNYETTEKCLSLLQSIKWADGIYCPYCKSKKISKNTEKIELVDINVRDVRGLFRLLLARYFTKHINSQNGFKYWL